ncbi:MAG: DUF2905 domain-containing protein [Acidihalobacter sp.]|uniref:DUF2905 domain-containing protein n=1 Tax=Acidihalobacter sp. TaxID=1872108 RepID=UPI00307CD954
MTRTLVILGLVLIAVGVTWPWISKLGLGRLPGDIVIRREGFTFYFPLTTSVIVSLVVSLLIWLFRK